MEDDYRQQRALRVVTALQANLEACAGINLIDVTLESSAEFSLEDYEFNTIEWDKYDYLSMDEPDGANEPA